MKHSCVDLHKQNIKLY